jgi:hypothetical protein
LVGEAIAGSSKKGNKGLYRMAFLSIYLNGIKRGVGYAFGHAVNHSSRKGVELMNFKVLAEVDAKEFVFNGEKPFELLSE